MDSYFVYNDARTLFAAAAKQIIERAHAAVQSRGEFSFVLSGGSTPKALYQMLAGAAGREMPWERTHIFFGDERHVPPDHPESNYHMAFEAVLSKVPIPPSHVHRMRGEIETGQAAADYEREIRRYFEKRNTAIRFDLILLGLGEDGHTASLFPESPALQERERLVTGNWSERLRAERITLTFPAINASACVIFLVQGTSKAAVLRAVRQGSGNLPAASIRPVQGDLIWLADKAASQGLPDSR